MDGLLQRQPFVVLHFWRVAPEGKVRQSKIARNCDVCPDGGVVVVREALVGL